ncbi:MAG: hypothetical protein IJ977_11045 [Fibrobacter sp.]|nr:hypothetical protein [Fibrobacter sp.]
MNKLRGFFQRFMMGRYGTDKLNIAILTVGVVVCLAGMFMPALLGLIFTALSYGLMFLAIYRCFSRNTYQRYRENSRYLRFLERLKDRQHRYFTCPRCRQTVRVPRGKGKIAITCPKCKEKFIKKT